jgi:8-oxo-dGTP pyrophosphatase MutT (NUDIX family)
MSGSPHRDVARVIVLDADSRVLLLRYDEAGGFWATPGGSLEEGEDHVAAALRELHEELGIDENRAELSAPIAQRRRHHAVGNREVHQCERYFVTRLTPADVDPVQLRTTRETVYPPGLADLITKFLTTGLPDVPVTLR